MVAVTGRLCTARRSRQMQTLLWVQPQRNTTAAWNQDFVDTSSELSDKPEHLDTVGCTANATDAWHAGQWVKSYGTNQGIRGECQLVFVP